MIKNLISESISYKIQCAECSFKIENDNIFESLVSLSQHIENFEHTKFELEIYDFDLAFVKDTRDLVKIFEEIDDSLLMAHLIDNLKDLGYDNTGSIIKNAIKNDILTIDDIEDNDIYLALTDFGEELWYIINK